MEHIFNNNDNKNDDNKDKNDDKELVDNLDQLKIIVNDELNTLISSKDQTKNWRTSQEWYINGKHNECEQYQIRIIEKIIGQPCVKTDDRLSTQTNDIINIGNPMKQLDGFEYTEDFDGKITKNDDVIYFNLKFVSDVGGAQTRTLREVYHFIECQLEHLLKYQKSNTYFNNILDGDTSYKHLTKFNYLLNKDKYIDVKKYVYIGDLKTFNETYKN